VNRTFERTFVSSQFSLKIPLSDLNPDQAKDMALRKCSQPLTA